MIGEPHRGLLIVAPNTSSPTDGAWDTDRGLRVGRESVIVPVPVAAAVTVVVAAIVKGSAVVIAPATADETEVRSATGVTPVTTANPLKGTVGVMRIAASPIERVTMIVAGTRIAAVAEIVGMSGILMSESQRVWARGTTRVLTIGKAEAAAAAAAREETTATTTGARRRTGGGVLGSLPPPLFPSSPPLSTPPPSIYSHRRK